MLSLLPEQQESLEGGKAQGKILDAGIILLLLPPDLLIVPQQEIWTAACQLLAIRAIAYNDEWDSDK